MRKHQASQSGFSAVEALLILVIVGILGFVGYYVWHAKQTTDKDLAVTSTSTPSGKTNQGQYLDIKDWHVKVKLTADINDATYHISGNTAWLSTAALDANATCKAYYTNNQTFQGITRYALTDQVDILDTPNTGSNTMTAAQAVKAEPAGYHKLGNYVYAYEQGNGQACAAQTNAQTNAFKDAFDTLAVN